MDSDYAELSTVFVILSDWRGRVVWTSLTGSPVAVGSPVWSGLMPESIEVAQHMHAQVASLRETHSVTVVNQDGKHYRCWLWPLDSPEIAVCTLCREVPPALSELTERESECLQLLAQGLPTREIANRLDLSTSTLHTHLTRAREKLKLDNLEALISLASRFCYPLSLPLIPPDESSRQPP